MDNFLGQITQFACTFAPQRWAMCQGQVMPISQNPALFALLGTAFGGNGTTNFGLPDLRGRLPNSMGQAPGLSPYTIGQTGGAPTVLLTDKNVPSHTHAFQAYNVAATTGSPLGALPAVGASSGERGHITETKLYSGNAPTVTLSSLSVNPVEGSNRPHDNMQPALAMNWCIAIEGIVPQRP
jgi:microcystin-dependent protein